MLIMIVRYWELYVSTGQTEQNGLSIGISRFMKIGKEMLVLEWAYNLNILTIQTFI